MDIMGTSTSGKASRPSALQAPVAQPDELQAINTALCYLCSINVDCTAVERFLTEFPECLHLDGVGSYVSSAVILDDSMRRCNCSSQSCNGNRSLTLELVGRGFEYFHTRKLAKWKSAMPIVQPRKPPNSIQMSRVTQQQKAFGDFSDFSATEDPCKAWEAHKEHLCTIELQIRKIQERISKIQQLILEASLDLASCHLVENVEQVLPCCAPGLSSLLNCFQNYPTKRFEHRNIYRSAYDLGHEAEIANRKLLHLKRQLAGIQNNLAAVREKQLQLLHLAFRKCRAFECPGSPGHSS